jgi:hypothetical protein
MYQFFFLSKYLHAMVHLYIPKTHLEFLVDFAKIFIWFGFPGLTLLTRSKFLISWIHVHVASSFFLSQVGPCKGVIDGLFWQFCSELAYLSGGNKLSQCRMRLHFDWANAEWESTSIQSMWTETRRPLNHARLISLVLVLWFDDIFKKLIITRSHQLT